MPVFVDTWINFQWEFYSASSDVMSHSQMDFDYPDINARSEDDKGSYIKGHPR